MKSPVYDFFEKIAPESIVTWVGLNTGKTAIIICVLTFLFLRDIMRKRKNGVIARFLGLFGIDLFSKGPTITGSGNSDPFNTSGFDH